MANKDAELQRRIDELHEGEEKAFVLGEMGNTALHGLALDEAIPPDYEDPTVYEEKAK